MLRFLSGAMEVGPVASLHRMLPMADRVQLRDPGST